MNLQLNNSISLVHSLPAIATQPSVPRNLSKSYLITLGLLVLGILLLGAGIAGAIFLPATSYFLAASFLVSTGLILGLVAIFSAIEDLTHKMCKWRKTCLELRNQLHDYNIQLDPQQITWKKFLFPVPSDIISSTYGISSNRIWCTVAHIFLGIGALLGSFCSGCLLPGFQGTITAASLGVIGGSLLVSGVKSYQAFILNSYGIIYLYSALQEKLSKQQAQQESSQYTNSLELKVAKLEEQVKNMVGEQASLVLEYEKRLSQSHQTIKSPESPLNCKKSFLAQKAEGFVNGMKSVFTLDMFWAGDDE